MEEQKLDYVLVPLGMMVFGLYHLWLLFTILRSPRRTVVGINAESRHQWVYSMMADPLKNGVLAVQTIRNNIMASTLLATTAITLSSLISVFVSNTSSSANMSSDLVYGNQTAILSSIKYFALLLCFLVAFLCNVQSIRYYAHHMLNATDEADKSANAPTRTYVLDAKAMAATPADVKEYPNSYVFIIDMPGLKSGDIKVQVEDDNVLLISGERKREEEKEGAKYVRMERRVGKFMRKFVLPENANTDAISAVCQDGVLTVTVEKLPPPEPKKPKTIEVKIA
ncbi:hypothetical protein F0562_025265 [Nyssa sinensis]|uniref:SHSP domain-containing protein n=1 Tax=Nyssa sinensis TaxID=561372 RepID=A0A5J5BHS5_9ASTE|nr:hypothetical protein F0562_025265 [Nyssa sinensis]